MLIKLKIVMNKINKFKPLPQGAHELSVVENQQVTGGPFPLLAVVGVSFAKGLGYGAGFTAGAGLVAWAMNSLGMKWP